MLSQATLVRIGELRQMILRRPLTLDEQKEAISLYRADRKNAAVTTAKSPSKTKKVIDASASFDLF